MQTRRHFLETSAALGLAPAAAQERRASPNDRIQIALIGAGGASPRAAEVSRK
jgi:hypothetical protein